MTQLEKKIAKLISELIDEADDVDDNYMIMDREDDGTNDWARADSQHTVLLSVAVRLEKILNRE